VATGTKKRNIAVDLGGTRLRVALADAGLGLTQRREMSTSFENGANGAVEQITALVQQALRETGLGVDAIGCLAVASPGPLDTTTGVVFSPPNMVGWGTVPLKQLLEERIGVPAYVMNDANAAGLGEFHFGSGRGLRNMVYLTVSTGIGGGVVVDGKLLEGSSGTAGEIGHMTVDRHGPPCNCGSVGCLEMLASGTSIGRRFRERLMAGETSIVQEWPGANGTAAEVARAAALGDPLALDVFTDSVEALGIGIVSCIHIFNPDVVALGGGVTKSGPLLFDIVQAVVDRYTMPVHRQAVRVVAAELGEDVGLVGAAALAREHRPLA
jgi:glucokinase